MEIVFTELLCLKYSGARWTPLSAKFSDHVVFQTSGLLSILMSLWVKWMFLEWYIEVDYESKIHILHYMVYK